MGNNGTVVESNRVRVRIWTIPPSWFREQFEPNSRRINLERRRESESVTLKITMIKEMPLLVKSLCMVCMMIEITNVSGMQDKKIRREKL